MGHLLPVSCSRALDTFAWGMASRRTATLPLSQNQIAQLVDAGYTRVSDLRAAQPARLAQDLGCSLVEALAILKTAAGPRWAQNSTRP